MKKFLFRVVLLVLSWSIAFFLGSVLDVTNAIYGLVIALGATGFFLLGYLLTSNNSKDEE